MAEPEDKDNTTPRKKLIDSRWVLWVAALAAVALICATATIAFGFRPGEHKPAPTMKNHQETVPDTTQPVLEVVMDSDGDVTATSDDAPSKAAANALQHQNAVNETVKGPQAAPDASITQSLHAGTVNLQAAPAPIINDFPERGL
jgi:hypothetical protein